MTWDYLIVGAGFAGAVLAERLASQCGATCLVIDHEAKRTAYYLLTIVNNSAEPIDLTVEIAAGLRRRSWRTRFESVVRFLARAFQRCQRFSQVIARSDPREEPEQDLDDPRSSSGRATGA